MPHLAFTRPRKLGSSPSRLIAIGVRDADRMPALPVVMNATIAAIAMMMTPDVPANVPAAVESGVRDDARAPASSVPTATKIASP